MTSSLHFLNVPVEVYDRESDFLRHVLDNVFVAQGGVPLECFIGIAARLICDVLDAPNFDSELDIDDAIETVEAEVHRLLKKRGRLHDE